MRFSEKYNKGGLFLINTKDFEYKSLEELFEESGLNESVIYILRAIYINTKGKFGNAPVFATDEYLVNIPKHLTDTCIDILSDGESVALINAGAVGFTIYKYTDSTFGKTCYGVKFVDID